MKRIFTILTFLPLLLMVFSCHYEIDDVFEKSSAVRIDEEIKRVDDLLKGAKNGWVLEYYASREYGGYNMYFKFNEDNTVTASSEVMPESSAISHYKIEQSQGVLLSFDEYNEVIHYFSNPKNPDGHGENGVGMSGDFEFRVISATESEIVLMGKKHGSKTVMRAMSSDKNWKSYLEAVDKIEEVMSASFFTLASGDKTIKTTAIGTGRVMEYTDSETDQVVKLPYIVTDEGFYFYNEFTFNGKSIQKLVFSAQDEKCYDESDKTTYIEVCPVPLSEAIQSGYWSMDQTKMSQAMLVPFSAAKEGSAKEKESIIYMFIGTGQAFGNDYNTGWGVVFVSGGYLGTLYFKAEVVDDNTIKLTADGADTGNGTYYYKNCNYNQISAAMSATFDLTTDNLKSPTWIKLTDTADPERHLTVSVNLVQFPFGEYQEN